LGLIANEVRQMTGPDGVLPTPANFKELII